ncbi:MAG: GHMP kinase [Rubritepida sp.]|nr:GHMP kinase [Rubritepida sp.]
MMIVSRTPLRVSFFGGGTDYPDYFNRGRGAVVGMAIDKYVYISALRLTASLDYRYKLSYSKVEMVTALEDIQHPVVREVIRHAALTDALDMSIMADLPARSGLGSSSSFTVGFLNLVAALQKRQMTKLDLARQAVFVVRELLHENVGVQDQYHAAFGGLNRFDFVGARTRITPVQMTAPCQAALTTSLFLLYTGVTRFASDTLNEQMARTRSGASDADLSHLLTLTDQAVDVLECEDPEAMLRDFGAMLHEGWQTKKRLSSKVSSPEIDALYDAARAAGALGGKLCGAGAGGFLLMLVPPPRQAAFLAALPAVNITPVGLDTLGATILTS